MDHPWTPEQIVKARLDDFRVFLFYIWRHLRLPNPTVMQYDMAHYMQTGPARMVIEAFRGIGKSYIAATCATWRLFLDPQLNIMLVSANQERADANSIFIKRLIVEVPWLRWLEPGPGQRTSNVGFDVGPALNDQSPSVKSVGLTGQLTGSRADIIIPDDIEVPKNSITQTMRDRVAELTTEFDDVLKPLPTSQIIYLGTPHTETTLYHRLPDRGFEVRVWPAEIPARPSVYQGRLAPIIMQMIEQGLPVGTPTDPQRFDREELLERKAAKGKQGYAMQYMLDTNPADVDKHPLKLHDLTIQSLDPKMSHVNTAWGNDRDLMINDLPAGGFDGDNYFSPAWKDKEMKPYDKILMAIDPSGGGKDETAYAIVALLFSQLYLLDVGGFVDGFGQPTLEALADKALDFHCNEVIIEKNYGGGMFGSLLRPVLIERAEARKQKTPKYDPEEGEVWHTGQKEVRILDVMEPIVSSHRLTIDRRVIEADFEIQQETPQYSFVQQFTRITREKGCLPHEDRLEAVQLACSHFVERLNKVKQKQVDAHKEGKLQEELKAIKRHYFGRRKRNPSILGRFRRG